METCCQGKDESGRTPAPDDLWGNEEGEQISFMSASLTRALQRVFVGLPQLIIRLRCGTPASLATPHPLDTRAENRGTFLQMTRPDRLKAGRINSGGHCLPLHHRKTKCWATCVHMHRHNHRQGASILTCCACRKELKAMK